MEKTAVRHIFVIGAKSLGQYGGYETFIDKLTGQHADQDGLCYHIATKANGSGAMDETQLLGVSDVVKNAKGETVSFRYHNAEVFRLKVPELGGATAILYDVKACRFFIRYCKENNITDPVFYILACRIGPFIAGIKRKIRKLGGVLLLNPDGHEWKRSKWSPPVRKYWKESERRMIRQADLVICDALAIESYIQEEYKQYNPRTTYISYGADVTSSTVADDDPALISWYQEKGVRPGEYDLVVGRFVPENNFETMIREYMKSGVQRKLVLITNENNALYESLEKKLHFSKDPRIVFAGPLYQTEMLKKVRENAFRYLHGHSVGGTNPSLLEALGSTELNLLYDVSFNREVAEDSALYWTLEEGNLSSLLDRTDHMRTEERSEYGEKAKARIKENYSWEKIAEEYERIFKDPCNP